MRIRRVEPYNRALSIYGVAFIDLGPGLKEIIYAVTANDRSDMKTRWESTP